MALPAANTAWPPAPHDRAFQDIAVHNAWYTGDPTELARVSTSNTHIGNRPSQYRGGLVGAASRLFWGRPVAADQERHRLHVPVASDISTTSADLLFSEPPRVLLPKDERDVDHAYQERLEELINTPVVHATWLEAAETASALGGVALRIVWDHEVADGPMLDQISADGIIPTWRYGRLIALTTWTILSADMTKVVRHIERHEPGRILHGVYEGTSTSLGRMVPFQDYPQTEWLADVVNADGAILTGTERLTAAYVPNIRPQRKWRRVPELALLGRSDYDSIEPIFDAIDEAYSSWMRDIRLGKARVFVDQSTLTNNGPGLGASFDIEQELFTGLNGIGSFQDGSPITPYQFQIRWEEHQRTIQDLTRVALRSAGYSPASFGDDDTSAQETATQVKSKQRLSERTRDKKVRYWKAAMGPLFQAMLDVDQAQFPGRADARYNGEPIEVRFPEEANQDVRELAETISLLDQANAISTDLKVRMLHPDWDAIKVEEEAARIISEGTVPTTPDPADFRPGIDNPEE